MKSRQQYLTEARPSIPSVILHENMNNDEYFQNTVLRPIIKLQTPLFIEVFKNYANKHKGVYFDLSVEKRLLYIENAIHKDMKFRNNLKGMVIGLFTVEEYTEYIKNSSALNKRMMHLVKQQIINSVQLIRSEELLTAI